jgi:hypothetical protein
MGVKFKKINKKSTEIKAKSLIFQTIISLIYKKS